MTAFVFTLRYMAIVGKSAEKNEFFFREGETVKRAVMCTSFMSCCLVDVHTKIYGNRRKKCRKNEFFFGKEKESNERLCAHHL